MTMGAKAKSARKGPRAEAAQLSPRVDVLLGKAQVCAALGCSVRHLQTMISSGEFPRPDMFLGVLPRWHVDTFNAHLKALCRKES